MRKLALCSVIFGLAAGMPAAPARAEVAEVTLAQQYGIGYLALTLMKHDQLVEKHLAAAGLKETKVAWSVLGAAAPMNDGLLAGKLHFAAGGVAPMITIWDRTRGKGDISGVTALFEAPIYLLTNKPDIKSVKDFTDNDRIAMPGAGSSMQTLYLQMEVTKHYGIDNFKKLNSILVNLSHPDAYNALISRGANVTGYFAAPPFQGEALKQPGISKIVSSYDIAGGATTFILMWASGKFRDENPKTYKAVLDALKEATAAINADRRRAAEIYVKDTGGKSKVDDIAAQLGNSETAYSLTPRRVLPLAEFMLKAGLIKTKPATWKDLFFPEAHHLDGS